MSEHDSQGMPDEVERGEHDHSQDEYASEPHLRDFRVTLLNWPTWLLLALIRGYQMTLSKTLPPNTCRFYTSCSHYGYQAVYKYGAIKGGLMAAWRVLRCNPFNPGGYDPVR
jgi:putative membrane protein insertion efficiency factor